MRTSPPRAARPKPSPLAKDPLRRFLADLAVDVHTGLFPLRRIASRHLMAAQAAAMPRQARVTVLEVRSEYGMDMVGAFLEVRPPTSPRCGGGSKTKTRVYWVAVLKAKGHLPVLTATVVDTQIFRGRKPAPKVSYPSLPLAVPVFTVRAELEYEALCTHSRVRWRSLETAEAFAIVGGELRKIVAVLTDEQFAAAGAMHTADATLRWIPGPGKRVHLGVIHRDKLTTSDHSPPGAPPAPSRYRCSLRVAVYEVAASGKSRKLSPAEVKQRTKTVPLLKTLPADMQSTQEDGCDY